MTCLLHNTALRICACIAALLQIATPIVADVSMPGATGGVLRYPNNNQLEEDGNAFGEAWIKQGLQFWQSGTTKAQGFYLGNLVRDTEPFGWNNAVKHGFGLQLSTRPTDHLELTFSARHDWSRELASGLSKQGWRLAIDYYYYQYVGRSGTFLGQPHRANVFKSYGTLAVPGSLDEGDDNVVLSVGGEYSSELNLDADGKVLLVPFIDLHLGWDQDQNNYNTKILPAFGVKVRRPLETGEFFAGVKVEADYRPITGSIDVGPIASAGWYYGW